MRTRYTYAFPRPSVTATIALFIQSTWNSNVEHVILGRRGRKDGAYSGYLCLPGGFLDAKVDTNDVEIEVQRHHYTSIAGADDDGIDVAELFTDEGVVFEPGKEAEAFNKPGETVEEAAIREIFEETGLVITPDRLELSHVHSAPNTDPRAHVVNICYFVVLKHEEAEKAVAGDDLEELVVESVYNVHTHNLAFNHNELFVKLLDSADRAYPDSEDDC